MKKRINPESLIYKYKTHCIGPKIFRNCQDPVKLFKDLTDGNVNPKEVLKERINFKSDLSEIRKVNPKSKSKDQISVTQHVENFFNLREKILIFVKIFFCYLKLNTNQNMEKVPKY